MYGRYPIIQGVKKRIIIDIVKIKGLLFLVKNCSCTVCGDIELIFSILYVEKVSMICF